jgi:hypothetical protein
MNGTSPAIQGFMMLSHQLSQNISRETFLESLDHRRLGGLASRN